MNEQEAQLLRDMGRQLTFLMERVANLELENRSLRILIQEYWSNAAYEVTRSMWDSAGWRARAQVRDLFEQAGFGEFLVTNIRGSQQAADE